MISPVTLEEFDILKPTPRTVKGVGIEGNSDNALMDGFRELISVLDSNNLNSEEKKMLLKTVTKFSHQFLLKGDKLGPTHLLKHRINTINNDPVNKEIYRYPLIHKEVIDKESSNLLRRKQ